MHITHTLACVCVLGVKGGKGGISRCKKLNTTTVKPSKMTFDTNISRFEGLSYCSVIVLSSNNVAVSDSVIKYNYW